MWPLLLPGGTIIYATCSIFRQENDEVIEAFSGELEDCVVQNISEKWGRSTKFGRQILPGDNDMDGFFYSVMKKTFPHDSQQQIPLALN